jgi:hypothetical protein
MITDAALCTSCCKEGASRQIRYVLQIEIAFFPSILLSSEMMMMTTQLFKVEETDQEHVRLISAYFLSRDVVQHF